MNKILALDNALAITGWSIFEDKNLLDYGVFKTSATDSIEKRLNNIYVEISSLFKKYNFNNLFFEDCQQQSNKNVQTFHKLSMVKGIILYWCEINKIPHTILSPSHWRNILKTEYNISWGKNRTNQKQAAKDFVKKHFNLKVSEDEADSICLGLAGIIENASKETAF